MATSNNQLLTLSARGTLSVQKSIASAIAPTENAIPGNHFQALWLQAEQLREENLALSAELDKLVQRLRVEVGTAERALGVSLRRQTEKLFVFANRKSITQRQRSTLFRWLDSNLNELHSMGMMDEGLANAMAKLHASMMGIQLNPDDERGAAIQLDEYFSRNSRKNSNQDDEEYLFDEVVDKPENETHRSPGYEGGNADSSNDQSNSAAGNLESDVDIDKPQDLFKVLFHRVARVLHPDKEQDTEKQVAKQALMKELLKARRSQDLMGVFQLYHDHVDHEATFSESEYQQLEQVLLRYIENETQRKESIVSKTTMHAFAYSRFYSNKPGQVTQKINKHKREIGQRQEELDHFLESVGSLKALKPYLQIRYNNAFFQW